MSRYFRSLAGAGLGLLALAAPALAQPAATQPVGLPANVRQAVNADPFRGQIEAFVTQQTGLLTDPVTLGGARDALANVFLGAAASPSFTEIYNPALVRALTPLANHENPAIRLNVAIISARVAERTNSVRFAAIIADLLNDENPAVVLWALRAARPIAMQMALNPAAGAVNLLPAIVDAAKKNVASGPIAADAYTAIVGPMNDRTFRNLIGTGPNAEKLVRTAVDAVHSIFEARNALWQKNAPPEPSVEGTRSVMNFLSDGVYWKLQTDAQRAKTVELSLGAGVAAADRQRNAINQARTELIGVVQLQGKTLQLISGHVNDAKLGVAAAKMGGVNPLTGPKEVFDSAAAVPATVKSVTAFKDVPLPGTLPPVAPAAAPAPAPVAPTPAPAAG